MSQITVNTEQIDQLQSQFKSLQEKLEQCDQMARKVKMNLNWEISSKRNIEGQLEKSQRSLQQLHNKTNDFTAFLQMVNHQFVSTDQRIKNQSKEIVYQLAVIQSMLTMVGRNPSRWNLINHNLLRGIGDVNSVFSGRPGIFESNLAHLKGILSEDSLAVLGNAGTFGALMSFALTPFGNWINKGTFNLTADTGAKGIVGILKAGTSVASSIYGMSKNISKLEKLSRMMPKEQVSLIGLKRFIGMEKIFKNGGSVAAKASTRFYNNFSKQLSNIGDNIGSGLKKGSSVKAGFFLADVALTGITRAIDNGKAAADGKMSTERAFAETVTETAIDVGGKILVSALVGSAIAAVAPAAATVFVVGAVTTGIFIGLDAFAKNVTEGDEDFAGMVSDGILDGAKAGVDAIKSGFNQLTNCFKNPKNGSVAAWAQT